MDFEIKNYLKEHGCITVPEAQKLGVSRAVLFNWAKAGAVERVAHGTYALPDSLNDDLWLISMRSENLIFSYETALALLKLHNRIPDLPVVTIPQGSSVPHSLDRKVIAHRVSPELHGLGRTLVRSFMGHEVPCYDCERTICDLVRNYTRMDIETYANALRNYAASSERNLPRLFDYARQLGIESKVHKALEILL